MIAYDTFRPHEFFYPEQLGRFWSLFAEKIARGWSLEAYISSNTQPKKKLDVLQQSSSQDLPFDTLEPKI